MHFGERKRALAIVGEGFSAEAKRHLELEGFVPIVFPKYSRLPQPMENHIDMLLLRLSNRIVSFGDYCDIAAYAFTDLCDMLPQGTKLHFVDEVPSGEYPLDALLNMLVIGKRIYTKSDTASPSTIALGMSEGYEIRHVKQGYPACTVLKLSDEAVITADRGLAKIFAEDGIRVTLIEDGGIDLPPYPYGFIGGCAGVYGGKVYFNGDVSLHPSLELIIDAIEREGMEIVCLSKDRLRDIGGIIFMEGRL